MKLYLKIFLTACMLFLVSCGHGFNPQYYYTKHQKDSSSGIINKPPVEPPAVVEADKDPFLVGDHNKPDYGGFNADIFDKWLFKASFRNNKLPIYKFFDDSVRQWIPGGKDWNNIPANYYKPEDKENVASGYGITGSYIYKYDKANPLYDNNGYLPGRMERFRFYSLYGKAVVVDLQQYLIAVDTYSKFVFAFGKITKTKTTFGELVPMEFEAIEYYGDKDFYEYDPIGYVDNKGDVLFYQHYITEFVANPTGYFPKDHGFTSIAEHKNAKPGKSPYAAPSSDTEASEEDKNKYEDEIKKLVKEYKFRDYSGYQKSPTGDKDQIDLESWKNAGYLGLSLTLYTYNLTDNGNILTIKTKVFNSNQETSKTYKLSVINTESRALYTNINDNEDSLSISIVDNNGNNTISVGGRILDANFEDYGPIFVDRVKGLCFKRDGEKSIGGGIGGVLSSTFPLSKGGKLKDLEYKFNEDGTEFTIKYSYDDGWFTSNWKTVEYHFKLARFDSSAVNTWTAKYECTDLKGTLGKYTRVVLRNGDGTANPGPDEIGTVIRSSMTLHSIDFAESPTVNMGLEMIADKR